MSQQLTPYHIWVEIGRIGWGQVEEKLLREFRYGAYGGSTHKIGARDTFSRF
jgi:hypothetical protein